MIQKPGNHPNFRKNVLGAKRPFSELSESSGVFSEQLSEFEISFSEYEIPFSEWQPTTWAIRKPKFSEQLPERVPELVGTHMKDSHLPQHSRSVFSRIGVVPKRQNDTICISYEMHYRIHQRFFSVCNCDPSIPPEECFGPKRPSTPLGGLKGRKSVMPFQWTGRELLTDMAQGGGDQNAPRWRRSDTVFRGPPPFCPAPPRSLESAAFCEHLWFSRIRSYPGKPNQKKGRNEKFTNITLFCKFGCFSLRILSPYLPCEVAEATPQKMD